MIKVSTNGRQESYPKTYALDIDEVRTTVPEISRTINDEEGCFKPSMEPEYESPLNLMKPRLPPRDNTRTSDESVQSRYTRGPRCKENVIYNSGCYDDDIELNDRRYTGYSLPNTSISNTYLDSPSQEKYVSFCYDNPLKVTDDEDVYAKPSPEYDGRRKEAGASENSMYESSEKTEKEWKTCSASTALSFNGIRNIHGGETGRTLGAEKRKHSRRYTTAAMCKMMWLILILSGAAFIFACLAFFEAPSYFKAFKPSSNEEVNRLRQKLELFERKMEENLTFVSQNIDEISNGLQKLANNTNQTFKESLKYINKVLDPAKFQGPRGYNGTQGSMGQSGPPGPAGPHGPHGPAMNIDFSKCLITSKTRTSNDDRRIKVTESDTKNETMFSVVCESSLKDGVTKLTNSSMVPNGLKYMCLCDKKTRTPITCTIRYLLCPCYPTCVVRP